MLPVGDLCGHTMLPLGFCLVMLHLLDAHYFEGILKMQKKENFIYDRFHNRLHHLSHLIALA